MKKYEMKSMNSVLVIAIAAVCIVAIITVGLISFGAYTNSLRAQRTVAAYESIRDKFSSNYLLREPTTGVYDNDKIIYVTSENAVPSIVVSVCNYPQGRQIKFYEENISYDLTMEYYRLVNDEYVKVTDPSYITGISSEDTDDYAVTLSTTGDNPAVVLSISPSTLSGSSSSSFVLTGGLSSSDTYTLSFGKDFVKQDANLFVKVTATPTDNRFALLSCIFKAALRAEGEQKNWTGAFNDSSDVSPALYDGFNFRITGTGSGIVTLTWDTNHLDLSSVSKIEILSNSGTISDPDSNGVATAEFPVDSDVQSLYDFQFYLTGGVEGLDWDDINDIVTFKYN